MWYIEWKLDNLYYFFRWSEYIALAVIIANTLVLALENYDDRDNTSNSDTKLNMIYHLISCLFAVEAAIKIIAMGFYQTRKSYLRNGWNVLDFIIVLLS